MWINYVQNLTDIYGVTDAFASNVTGERYNVSGKIQYKRCGLLSVGETGQPLHCKMNVHRFDSKHKRIEESPVAAHFNSMGHSLEADMSVMITNKVRNDIILTK